MTFEFKLIGGTMTFTEADFKVLQAEDCFARADGESLSSLLEDLPEVQDVGYYMLAKSPHITLLMRSTPTGGAPDMSRIHAVVAEHLAACHKAALQ